MILWYKQSSAGDLQLLGYLYRENKHKETGLDMKIQLDGNGANNSTLILESISSDATAVYFCVASIFTVLKFFIYDYKNLMMVYSLYKKSGVPSFFI